jgi:hypothetical protein
VPFRLAGLFEQLERAPPALGELQVSQQFLARYFELGRVGAFGSRR